MLQKIFRLKPLIVRSLPLLALGLLIPYAFAGTTIPSLPDATFDTSPTPSSDQTVVLAGGCFWGMEGVFEHVKGVKNVVSGYSGGLAETATYPQVSGGDTGHAESVKIVYDPAQISFATLLKIYLSVAHDPTELNKQGPDHGTQYRSEIFYTTPDQQKTAQAYLAQLDVAEIFSDPIVTKIEKLDHFYPAEDYHQDYMVKNPAQPYIVTFDRPKVDHLKAQFPDLYR